MGVNFALNLTTHQQLCNTQVDSGLRVGLYRIGIQLSGRELASGKPYGFGLQYQKQRRGGRDRQREERTNEEEVKFLAHISYGVKIDSQGLGGGMPQKPWFCSESFYLQPGCQNQGQLLMSLQPLPWLGLGREWGDLDVGFSSPHHCFVSVFMLEHQ